MTFPVLTALAGCRWRGGSTFPCCYEIRAFWEDAAVGNATGMRLAGGTASPR